MIEQLYKRDAQNNILIWKIECDGDCITVSYGILNKKIHSETIKVTKKNEYSSRVEAKRKEGYKTLSDVYDNAPERLDSNNDLEHYLKLYLPKFNTTSEGFVLPMLAKTLEDNRPFDKIGFMLGQWKINGLRCLIGAVRTNDLFSHVRLTYTSREGTKWNLPHLDSKILPFLSSDLIDLLVEEGAYLDGELYLPGYNVNDINHFVKNADAPQHHQLQYWCYDLAYDNMTAVNRNLFLCANVNIPEFISCVNKENHLNNKEQFVLLPTVATINNITDAINVRDKYISNGFEGLILRDPNASYAFGKRNSSMFKFKRKEDGLFEIVDIKSDKRDLPIYVLRNDINSELFECTLNCSVEEQKLHLHNKDNEIGKSGLVEFRERSGVKQVPFHAKLVKINM